MQALFRWKPVAVERELREGDELDPGYTVLDVPGHSPGHIALWRERDRTQICGDVFLNLKLLHHAPRSQRAARPLYRRRACNRQSARRLAELKSQLVLFGHGKPLRDPAKLQAFAQSPPHD